MIVHFSAKLLTTVMEINLDTNEPSLWDFNLLSNNNRRRQHSARYLSENNNKHRIIYRNKLSAGRGHRIHSEHSVQTSISCKRGWYEDKIRIPLSLPLISKKMEQQHFLSHHHNQLMDGVLGDGAHKVVLSDVRLYIHLRAREQRSNCKGLELSPISLCFHPWVYWNV